MFGQFFINLIAVAGGLVTVTIGLVTYRQSQTIRKKDIMKDIIDPLINEFDSPKFKIAKDLLDNKKVLTKSMDAKGQPSEQYYTMDNLKDLLRDRRTEPALRLTEDEKEIREAFDAFLNFFVKLEYLLNIKILDKNRNELDYFYYFIDLAARQEAVTNFMKIYRFPLRGMLDPRLEVIGIPKLSPKVHPIKRLWFRYISGVF
jgi:hypothetical protein